MKQIYYNSRIDWWIPVVVVVTVSVAFIGPLIDGEIFLVGLLLGVWLSVMEIVMFASVKYQICDGRIGIRNLTYKWEWLPIDKISEVKKIKWNTFRTGSFYKTNIHKVFRQKDFEKFHAFGNLAQRPRWLHRPTQRNQPKYHCEIK